ncbi:MAG: hypothetical protein CM15mL5_1310 [uncultured marine virus]|nr:MAG: hypothetical protein CM15mL5_1310 [uncultured marine virus]
MKKQQNQFIMGMSEQWYKFNLNRLMKEFDKFIEEAAKRCPAGQYYCFTDKKCKKIPMGYHVGRRGYLEMIKMMIPTVRKMVTEVMEMVAMG